MQYCCCSLEVWEWIGGLLLWVNCRRVDSLAVPWRTHCLNTLKTILMSWCRTVCCVHAMYRYCTCLTVVSCLYFYFYKISKPFGCWDNFEITFIILAHIHYRKLATGGCTICPPNMVCAIVWLHCLVKSWSRLSSCSLLYTVYLMTIIVSFCQNFMKIILKESYLMNITYLQVTDRHSSVWEIIAMAADDAVM